MDTLLDYNARLLESKKMIWCLRELKKIKKCTGCKRFNSSLSPINIWITNSFGEMQKIINNSVCRRCIESGDFAVKMCPCLRDYDDFDEGFLYQLFYNMYFNGTDIINIHLEY